MTRIDGVLRALLAGGVLTSLHCTTVQKIPVHSDPEGARVLIDGKDSGQVTPTELLLTMDEDQYEVTIVREGYNPSSRVLRLQTDIDVLTPGEMVGTVLCAPCCLGLPLLRFLRPIEVEQSFQPRSLHAELDLEGQGLEVASLSPESATLHVDGRLSRPLEGRYLVMTPGEHEVRVEAPGYRPFVAAVRVTEGRYEEFRVALGVEGQGLLLAATPIGAQVFVDGKLARTVQEGVERLRTSPGPHELRIEHKGYTPFIDVVEIPPDRYDSLHVALRLEGQGVLVHAPRHWRGEETVQILVDGTLVSSAFEEPLSLAPGTYQIEVQVRGYRSWSQPAQVREGQYLEIQPSLKR